MSVPPGRPVETRRVVIASLLLSLKGRSERRRKRRIRLVGRIRPGGRGSVTQQFPREEARGQD